MSRPCAAVALAVSLWSLSDLSPGPGCNFWWGSLSWQACCGTVLFQSDDDGLGGTPGILQRFWLSLFKKTKNQQLTSQQYWPNLVFMVLVLVLDWWCWSPELCQKWSVFIMTDHVRLRLNTGGTHYVTSEGDWQHQPLLGASWQSGWTHVHAVSISLDQFILCRSIIWKWNCSMSVNVNGIQHM